MKKINTNYVIFLLPFCGVLLTGCSTEYGYRKTLNSWVGDTEDNLIRSWGPASQKADLSDNSHLLEYIFQDQGYVPQYTTPVQAQTTLVGNYAFTNTAGGQTFGGYSVPLYCQTLFYVDSNKKITGWKYAGNACRN